MLIKLIVYLLVDHASLPLLLPPLGVQGSTFPRRRLLFSNEKTKRRQSDFSFPQSFARPR